MFLESLAEALKTYQAHRFMGITDVIRRILTLWAPIVKWYKARVKYVSPPPTFHLQDQKENLEQLLSVLDPILKLCTASQVSIGSAFSFLFFS
jgi:hypothetical protein